MMVAVFRIRSAFSSAANALARLSPPASVTKSIYTLVSPLRSDMRARRAAGGSLCFSLLREGGALLWLGKILLHV